MDLRHLSYFMSVVEHGSINAASRELLIGQPSLSRQIRKLERDLGVQLFSRGHRLDLTPIGTAFVPIARDLLSRVNQAHIAVKSLYSNSPARLTIAAPHTTVADVIAPYISTAEAQGALTDIREVLPIAVYQELFSGRADLVIATTTPPARYSSLVVGTAPIWAQVPAEHVLAAQGSVLLDQLASYAIAIVDDNHFVRRIFDDAMASRGLSTDIAFETQSSHASQALAASHRAVCISSDDSRFGLKSLSIVPTSETAPLAITLFAAWDPQHYAAGNIAETAAKIRNFYAERHDTNATIQSLRKKHRKPAL